MGDFLLRFLLKRAIIIDKLFDLLPQQPIIHFPVEAIEGEQHITADDQTGAVAQLLASSNPISRNNSLLGVRYALGKRCSSSFGSNTARHCFPFSISMIAWSIPARTRSTSFLSQSFVTSGSSHFKASLFPF